MDLITTMAYDLQHALNRLFTGVAAFNDLPDVVHAIVRDTDTGIIYSMLVEVTRFSDGKIEFDELSSVFQSKAGYKIRKYLDYLAQLQNIDPVLCERSMKSELDPYLSETKEPSHFLYASKVDIYFPCESKTVVRSGNFEHITFGRSNMNN